MASNINTSYPSLFQQELKIDVDIPWEHDFEIYKNHIMMQKLCYHPKSVRNKEPQPEVNLNLNNQKIKELTQKVYVTDHPDNDDVQPINPPVEKLCWIPRKRRGGSRGYRATLNKKSSDPIKVLYQSKKFSWANPFADSDNLSNRSEEKITAKKSDQLKTKSKTESSVKCTLDDKICDEPIVFELEDGSANVCSKAVSKKALFRNLEYDGYISRMFSDPYLSQNPT